MPRVISLTSLSGKMQQLAVLADHRDVVAVGRHAEHGLRRLAVTFSTCLPLRVVATHLVLGHDEAVAARGGDQQLAAGLVDEELDDVVVLLQVDHQAHRLAVAAPARQLVGVQRVEPCRWWQNSSSLSVVCALTARFSLSPCLNVELVELVLMALERADPALLGEDDGDRLLLDQRLG